MTYILRIFQDRSFIKKTFALTVPVTLQNLLNNLLNLIDSLLIVRLGETSVAAVGLANRIFFVFSLLMFGVCSGSGILASQYYGKREMPNIKRVLRISLLIGIAGSLIFAIPGIFFPRLVMRIFTPNSEMIGIGAKYLVIIAISYPITACTNSYVAVLRSMNYVKLPMIITTLAIAVNTFLNFGLIFGMFGLPKLGVAGAALATVIARILELSLLIMITRFSKPGDDGVGDFIHTHYDKEKEKDTPFIHKSFLNKYIHTASPVIVNEFMWGLGITMYSLVYGRMEELETAAITMAGTLEQLIMVFFFGICNAAAVILGNELGADELENAREHAQNFMILQFLLSIIGGVLTFLLRNVITSIFPVSQPVDYYIKMCITVLAAYMPAKALNTLLIVAVLRCGGDTKAALFLDVSGVWLIGIPMAVLGGLVFHFPIYIVYGMVMFEEIYKVIFGYLRYRKRKWLKNIVTQ